jgi:hypothetical protein
MNPFGISKPCRKSTPIRFFKEVGGEAVRTDVTDGVMYTGPHRGDKFTMFGEAIDPDCDVRMISTSPVQQIIKVEPCVVRIVTENSTYRIEIGGKCEWPDES